MGTEVNLSPSEGMMPGILASAKQLAAGDENLVQSLADLRMLTHYLCWFMDAHGGRNVALLPEMERVALLPKAQPINSSLRIICSGLEQVSVRTVLLKMWGSKTVEQFLETAESYDEWLETLEMSLNHEFLAMVMDRMAPHLREAENAI